MDGLPYLPCLEWDTPLVCEISRTSDLEVPILICVRVCNWTSGALFKQTDSELDRVVKRGVRIDSEPMWRIIYMMGRECMRGGPSISVSVQQAAVHLHMHPLNTTIQRINNL